MSLVLLAALAHGGYGDAIDGYPSWGERAMHLWTNAARVDPEAFEEDYQADGCSFDDFLADEQVPKPPVLWNQALNDAARFHSQDMSDNDHFAHESSDGTSFADRISRYYSGAAGENIAMGHADDYDVVFRGWMCSDGHRANIMNGGWDELGTGEVGSYRTQDFGSGGVGTRALAMGFHEPQNAGGDVTLWVDFYGGGDAPDEVLAVLDGVGHPLELAWGEPDMGIYGATVDLLDRDCHQYYFHAEVGGEATRYPEEGSWGWGDCAWDDEAAMYIASQYGIEGRDDLSEPELRERFDLVGCATGGGATGGWLASLLLLGLRRRS